MSNPVRLFLPVLVVGLAAVYLFVEWLPPHAAEGKMRLEEFGRIPIQEGGRVKPVDSLARNSLLIISGKQTFKDADDHDQPAIRWLLDVVTSGHNADSRRVIRVDNESMREAFGWPARPDHLYSLEDMGAMASRLQMAAAHARQMSEEQLKKPGVMDAIDLGRQIELFDKVVRFDTPHKVFRIDNDQLLSLFGLERREGFRYAFAEFSWQLPRLLRESARAEEVDEKQRSVYEAKVLDLQRHVNLYLGLAQLDGNTLHIVPPAGPDQDWRAFAAVQEEVQRLAAERLQKLVDEKHIDRDKLSAEQRPALIKQELDRAWAEISPAGQKWSEILHAYEDGQTERFNQVTGEYRQLVGEQMPGPVGLADFEFHFNHFAPFYQCMVLYATVFVLACCAWLWLGWTDTLSWTAFGLAVLTLLVHTWALGARMYLQGRPPVTNLYSSAVFIGWGAVIVCLVLEGLFRNGIGNVVASVLGFSTMLIAHFLAVWSEGDTLEMMRAVLDTNFWLATHVTCVTFGYTATFVAGFLGIMYVVLGVFTPRLDPDRKKTLGQMIYGIICFATLLSFTGTVLGGIWADQSWGRFWGWDPKENGALLIVIWNALVLHARWSGLVRQRGMAVLAIIGNIVTAWSWFGTNQLGVGLHAYGFNKHLAEGLRWFWLSQLVLVGIGTVPLTRWRSKI